MILYIIEGTLTCHMCQLISLILAAFHLVVHELTDTPTSKEGVINVISFMYVCSALIIYDVCCNEGLFKGPIGKLSDPNESLICVPV